MGGGGGESLSFCLGIQGQGASMPGSCFIMVIGLGRRELMDLEGIRASSLFAGGVVCMPVVCGGRGLLFLPSASFVFFLNNCFAE